MKHELVPDFRILSEKEKEELLKRHKVTIDRIPKILESDPVVKKIGAKVGDILEIKRKSISAGSVVYYRVVIKG